MERESKAKTIKKIAIGNITGNFMHDYYKIRASFGVTSSLYDRICLSGLEKLGEHLPKSTRNLIDFTSSLSEFYVNSALPRLY